MNIQSTCEVCRRSGESEKEQVQIKRDGICLKCAPIKAYHDNGYTEMAGTNSNPSVGKRRQTAPTKEKY